VLAADAAGQAAAATDAAPATEPAGTGADSPSDKTPKAGGTAPVNDAPPRRQHAATSAEPATETGAATSSETDAAEAAATESGTATADDAASELAAAGSGTVASAAATDNPPSTPAAVDVVTTQTSVAPHNVSAHAVGEQPVPEPGRRRRAARRGDDTAPEAAGRAPAYTPADRDAVYRVIRERRDIGNDFLSDDLPDDVLTRVLESAHTAPSVGFAQPWDFIVLRSAEVRQSVYELALRQRKEREMTVPRRRRAKSDAVSEEEAIVRAPVSVVVTCDPTRGGHSGGSGREEHARRAPYLAALAVENLWLAARAEGLGVDWLSFAEERELAELLDLPDHLEIVAYLCLGYVREFTPASPALPASAEWGRRRPLAWAVHEEQYGRRALPGDEPMSLLSETTQAIRPLDAEACAQARRRHERMVKPRGSLGALEAVTEQIAGLTGVCPPAVPEPAAIAIFAGDHGVHAQGVAHRPQEATAQSVLSVLEGRGVVSAFAAQLGVDICVIDVGVASDLPERDGLVPRKVRYGTADFSEGAAMTRSEGIETARDLVAAGNRCLLTGDLGVANSTASAALLAAFTKASASQVTGYGTGIDEQAYAHKVDVVTHALRTHQPDPEDPVGVLAAVGGLEHAAIAGFVLGAAALRVPLILDGVTACAAALAAQALCPEAMVACVAGHRSAEPGHALALEALGVTPLADIELHTGEGAGAVLGLPLVQSAVRALRDVALADEVEAGDATQPADGAENSAGER
jgi:nicotinate-nucleotide--dimethylbenzimidazole phosphoribosyltransferase